MTDKYAASGEFLDVLSRDAWEAMIEAELTAAGFAVEHDPYARLRASRGGR